MLGRFLLRTITNIIILILFWFVLVWPFNITLSKSIQGSVAIVEYFGGRVVGKSKDFVPTSMQKDIENEKPGQAPKYKSESEMNLEEKTENSRRFKDKLNVYFHVPSDYGIMNHGFVIGIYCLLAGFFKFYMKSAEIYDEDDIVVSEHQYDDYDDMEENFEDIRYYESLKDDPSNGELFYDTRNDKWDFK